MKNVITHQMDFEYSTMGGYELWSCPVCGLMFEINFNPKKGEKTRRNFFYPSSYNDKARHICWKPGDTDLEFDSILTASEGETFEECLEDFEKWYDKYFSS